MTVNFGGNSGFNPYYNTRRQQQKQEESNQQQNNSLEVINDVLKGISSCNIGRRDKAHGKF